MNYKLHKLKKEISTNYFKSVIKNIFCDFELEGDTDLFINSISSLNYDINNSLKWCKFPELQLTGSGNIYIVSKKTSVNNQECIKYALIKVNNPKFVFNYIVKELIKANLLQVQYEMKSQSNFSSPLISQSNVEIDKSSFISQGVVIYPNVRIGKNCFIGPNTVIGAQGFGFVKNNEREDNLERVIHIGGVYIGDNVNIGSNTCIDAGMIDSTYIESNVAIDNLVHIAHNSHIETGVIIVAGSVLSGGSNIGKNSWLSPNSVSLQNVNLGENSVIGAGSVLRKSVPKNTTVYGNPMKLRTKK